MKHQIFTYHTNGQIHTVKDLFQLFNVVFNDETLERLIVAKVSENGEIISQKQFVLAG